MDNQGFSEALGQALRTNSSSRQRSPVCQKGKGASRIDIEKLTVAQQSDKRNQIQNVPQSIIASKKSTKALRQIL